MFSLFINAGPEDVKMVMASTLAEVELTDHNKASLFEGGALGPLLQLISRGDFEMKMAAVKALRNLSSLAENGLRMIREGAMRPLLDLLFWHSPPTSSLHEQVAATIMHLAVSTMSQKSSQPPISLLDSDDDVFKLFSLVNLTGPSVQRYILQTFCALCQSPSASSIKQKLMTTEVCMKLYVCVYCAYYFFNSSTISLLARLREMMTLIQAKMLLIEWPLWNIFTIDDMSSTEI